VGCSSSIASDRICLSGDLPLQALAAVRRFIKATEHFVAHIQTTKQRTMKRILFAAMALIGLNMASQAQTTAPKKATASTVTVTKTEVAKAQPAKAVALPAASKPATKPMAVQPTTKASPVKADGTADMRFKANKDAANAKPKLKKDGTPDKRFKQNKKQ